MLRNILQFEKGHYCLNLPRDSHDAIPDLPSTSITGRTTSECIENQRFQPVNDVRAMTPIRRTDKRSCLTVVRRTKRLVFKSLARRSNIHHTLQLLEDIRIGRTSSRSFNQTNSWQTGE
jgi:queuine/archaeosine tRNA-ribosyltransferase